MRCLNLYTRYFNHSHPPTPYWCSTLPPANPPSPNSPYSVFMFLKNLDSAYEKKNTLLLFLWLTSLNISYADMVGEPMIVIFCGCCSK
jgi:hypothetical protein